MVGWVKSKIKINDLYLDDTNLRLPLFRSEQDVLIKELVEDEDVFEILESIITHGYYKHIDLIVINEENKYITMDGNRRLTSCKIITKSEDVPHEILQKADKVFGQKLRDFDRSTIAELYVSIAPSREEVYPYIHTIHTQDLSKNWNPSSLALSIKNMLERGKTIAEIEEKYKLTRDQIEEYIVLAEVYEIVIDQNGFFTIPKDSIRKFDFETLKNIYSSKPGLKFLNIKIKDNKIRYNGNPITTKKALKKISHDIYQTGMVFSKSKSDEKKISQYLDRIKEFSAAKKITASINTYSNQPFPFNTQPNSSISSELTNIDGNSSFRPTNINSPIIPPRINTNTTTNTLTDGSVFPNHIPNTREAGTNQSEQNDSFPLVSRQNSFEAENCFTKIRFDTINSNIDKDLKEIALYDLEEAFKAYKAEAYKASIVMIGAFLEGIMLAKFLEKIKKDILSKAQMSQQELEREITIKITFERLIHLTKEQIFLEENHLVNVQKSRNIIHPWKTYIGDIELNNNYTRFLNSLTSLALASKRILEHQFPQE